MDKKKSRLSLVEHVHFLHRAWRYRLVSEPFGIRFAMQRDIGEGVAVDIGANRGIYSYWMSRRLGPHGRIVAFEPQPELNKDLYRLRETMGLRQMVIAGCGLSDQPGELSLCCNRNNPGWATLVPEDTVVDEGNQIVRVPVTTLDAYFSEHDYGPVRFLKCDVEGHEPTVFRGGRELIARDRPEVLVECHGGGDNLENETFTVLQEMGYRGYCFAPGGLQPVERYAELSPTLHQRARADFVFLPEERAAARLAA